MLQRAFFALGALAATAAAAASYDLKMFPRADFPRATCNDGTMSGYYIKRPAAPSNLWIVFLEGGG